MCYKRNLDLCIIPYVKVNTKWLIDLNIKPPDVEGSGLEKAKELEIKLPTFIGSQRKQRNSRKNIYFCVTDYAEVFDQVDHNKLKNYERDGNIRPPFLSSEKTICGSRNNRNNWTWNNEPVQNWERSMTRLYPVTLLV